MRRRRDAQLVAESAEAPAFNVGRASPVSSARWNSRAGAATTA